MTHESLDDTRGLIEAAHAGDASATDELFRRYYPVVLRVAELRMGQPIRGRVEAEDVAQESLLDAFQSLDRFEHRSKGSFRNWLARIVENNVRDMAKGHMAQKRGAGGARLHAELGETSLSASLFPGNEPTPSQVAMGAELDERIAAAMQDGLGEPYREVLLLRDLCGMDYAEVAASMGYSSESTIRSMHARALQKLQELLRLDEA